MRRAFPYQKEALAFCAKRRHAALFMEMRLGKCLVLIRAARAWNALRVLIVAPLSTHADWIDELESEEAGTVTVVSSLADVKAAAVGWFLVGYERLRSTPEIARVGTWDVVGLDESPRIKNPKAQITKLATTCFRGVPHRMLLSGLPAPESSLDYFCQFQFLIGGLCGRRSYWNFRDELYRQVGYDWSPKPGTRERIKEEIDRHAFVLTRKQAGVASDKVYSRRVVPMSREQKKIVKEIESEWSANGEETDYRVVVETWLAGVMGGFEPKTGELIGHGKVEELLRLLRGELAQEQVVVFFRFNREIQTCADFLKKQKITNRIVWGAQSPTERAKRVDAFRRGAARVLLCQVKCMRYGVDLSCASTAIFYSNPRPLEDRLQSEDRIAHPKKKDRLLYIDLVTDYWVDEATIRSLRMKEAGAAFFRQRVTDYWEALQSKAR